MFPKDTEQYQFNYIYKPLCAVIHEKRIAALFFDILHDCSTSFFKQYRRTVILRT